MNHPIDKVQWVPRETLQANNWNPNRVAPPELDLLKRSIMEDGWTTAIVVQDLGDDGYEIIDGFHRWTLSADPDVHELTGGMIPIVVVTMDDAHARISTIRHNRARGQHALTSMADLVVELEELGQTEDDLMERLGMEREEVVRLRQRGAVTQVYAQPELNEAWKPAPMKP